jgi:hypothetical protein
MPCGLGQGGGGRSPGEFAFVVHAQPDMDEDLVEVVCRRENVCGC